MRGDPGFFALDRAAMRRAKSELGDGRAFLFFLGLAADANRRVYPSGNPREIAEDFDLSAKGVVAMLTKLVDRGWIEWEKPPNQHVDGRVLIVRDLERARTRASTGASTPASTPASAETGEATRGNDPVAPQNNKNKEQANKEPVRPLGDENPHLTRLSSESGFSSTNGTKKRRRKPTGDTEPQRVSAISAEFIDMLQRRYAEGQS